MKINTSFLWLFTIALALTSCGLDETPSSVLTEVPEDRNLTISGGGKISWDSTNKQVSFTGNIVVRDHRTDKVTTITTAASPIPLTNENDVAYFERAIAPETNQTVEALEIAAGGTVPERTETSGPVVLFHRTDENTLWIPWVQREMLNGDFWQWGTQLSWYERITASHKPAYTATSSGTVVTVPGSKASPAVVNIDGKLYANTDSTNPATVNISQTENPRGGLDSESVFDKNIAYYLYAIPATTGRTFDIVASQTPPNDKTSAGPSGYSSWSYIGSASTSSGVSQINAFKASHGRYIAFNELVIETQSGADSTGFEKHILNVIPVTAEMGWFQTYIDGLAGGGEIDTYLMVTGVETVGETRASDSIQVRLQEAETVNLNSGWVPILEPQTIYMRVSSANNLGAAKFTGWQEDPMAYK